MGSHVQALAEHDPKVGHWCVCGCIPFYLYWLLTFVVVLNQLFWLVGLFIDWVFSLSVNYGSNNFFLGKRGVVNGNTFFSYCFLINESIMVLFDQFAVVTAAIIVTLQQNLFEWPWIGKAWDCSTTLP